MQMYGKTSCTLNETLQCKNLVYSCKVSAPNVKESQPHSIGLTEHTIKDRLYKHNNTFKYESKRSSKYLSNFMWGNKKRRLT